MSTGKRSLVLSALAGREVDRVPVGFWGHDFEREWSAQGLADAMCESVERFDYDYLKVNPRATYYAEAWGCRYEPQHGTSPKTVEYVLHEASVLPSVQTVDGGGGPFAEQLEALRLIRARLGDDVPLMQTVFSPLSVLGRLANGDREAVRGWMQSHADDVHGALDAITSTLADYAKACLSEGADGIFFATTEWGTYDNATWEEYEAFGRPYDLRVLGAAAGAPFNVLHVCRPHSMLERLIDYPVAAFNWAVHEDGNPSLAEAQELTDRAVMGGVDQVGTLLNGSAADVAGQVRDAVAQTGGWRLLIAPGCSIAPETPPENIRAAVEAARSP